MSTTIDIAAATAFMTAHARVLDRRRFALHQGRTDAEGVLAALEGYRNADGGYGWALEPDLRCERSQPVAALHAFEVFEECAVPTARARELCDWLEAATLPDGGLPFALPFDGPDAAGSAPFWVEADPSASSLHMTAELAGAAHRVARHDPGVRDHPWLARATEFCRRRIAALEGAPPAIEFRFVLDLLDTVHDTHPWAPAELARLAAFLPRGGDGAMAVEGGAPGEAMRPLDVAPRPGRPLRSFVDPRALAADLDRLAAGQCEDGGWTVDWAPRSPAGALEWRGHATVRAVALLTAHGRLPGPGAGSTH
ncbi:hypothetical protein ACFPZ0_13130 [Streptomonospora nanhaiensis]|uniref:hypothetical protein n=1 Tax=Streptomonospora nanhaiensis TaxID=1323731 RepID=UPI001C9A136E|nr:hypothetical protein [Streptomonospora nanhaiensis]MBX9389320.1 hypothetical protein [Streptomonospora nanhaiensis]